MFERAGFKTPICEISSKATISGRRPIKVVLHEIFPDEDHYQANGLSWQEEFVVSNMESVIGMSIVAEFLTEDRDVPYGHGMTSVMDNMPLFEDATMVGHFEKVYIDDIEIEGEQKRVLVAEGTLDEMRYPKFVAWLREHMAEGSVKGSVEIVGKPQNNGSIIYSGGWKEVGRVPQIYDYSGYAILSVKPADEAAIVMELNNKNKGQEEETMDEKFKTELLAAISETLTETNSKWDEYWAQVQAKEAEIAQLQADIKEKEAEIAQLRADLEKYQADQAAAEAGLTAANEQNAAAQASLAEANAKIEELEKEKAVSELNAALADFTDEQKAVAKEDIEAFNENPGSVEINAIVGKICTEMVRVSREKNIAETNASQELDIFGMTDPAAQQDDGSDVNVF